MTCILRAGGVNFQIEEFVGESPLAIGSSWRNGEKRFPRSKTNEEVNSSSGVRVVASEADFSELSKQLDDVTLFLTQNLESVKHLSSFPGVEWAVLDFGAEIHPPGWASFTFPFELLRLAGAAGVEISLSVYPTEEESEADA